MQITAIRIIIVCVLLGLTIEGGARVITIPAGAPSSALQRAIEQAHSGDTLEVQGGYFEGPITIHKPLVLSGHNGPIIDAREKGTVVSVLAPQVVISGFIIQNSGDLLNEEHAGVSVDTSDVIIENNQILNVLFGVYLRKADRTIVRNNRIEGKKNLDIPRRGDLIRAWYSNDLLIENNILKYGRDVIVWFSKNTALRGNQIENARYGIHFMYSTNCEIVNNILTGNSVGAYLMYSKRLLVKHNTAAYNRGPSGFGIGLKDLDNIELIENLVVDNRVGIFIDNSPREYDSRMTYSGNVIAYNDIGMHMLAYVRNSSFQRNSFIENYEQVAVSGIGQWESTQWQKNFWSDYAGFDQNRDGMGDIPYRAEKLFESLIDQHKALRLFIYSPAIQAVNFAAKAFPVVKPQPKLMDPTPRMEPYFPAGPSGIYLPTRWPMIFTAAGLILFGWASIAGFFLLTGIQRNKTLPSVSVSPAQATTPPKNERMQGVDYMIQVQHLTKRFGRIVAVDDVSFTIKKSEAVALWGSNGAGKTTVLRCLLGVLPFEGNIQINGFDVARESKAARHMIGFVPQEISFHDNLTVSETLDFYARLRKTTSESLKDWKERLELGSYQEKTVKELSGGMKQRLALAVALLSDPAILFLDEPTANLDMKSRENFLGLLEELRNEGKTIVFSSHRMEEVFSFANRVLVLDQGKLIVDAPPAEVYQHLGKATLLRLFLPQSQLDEATKLLTANGFKVSRNGMGIKVQVEFHSKGKPIALLANAGITVEDFEYEVELI